MYQEKDKTSKINQWKYQHAWQTPICKDLSLVYVCKALFYKHIFGVSQAILPYISYVNIITSIMFLSVLKIVGLLN